MLGPTHRLFGGFAGVSVATAVGEPWSMVAMSGIVATASSHGWLSPDVDQTRPWEAVRKRLPGFCDQVFNHRTGLSHWWGLPVLAWLALDQLPAEAVWPATVLLVGWVSHLIGDAMFGSLSLLPGGGPTFGLGLTTGGRLERRLAPLLGVGIFLVLLYAAGVSPTDLYAMIERTIP